MKCRHRLGGLPRVSGRVKIEVFDREKAGDGRDVVAVGGAFVVDGPALRTINGAVVGISSDLAVGVLHRQIMVSRNVFRVVEAGQEPLQSGRRHNGWRGRCARGCRGRRCRGCGECGDRVGLSSLKVAPTTSATTATVMNTYDNVTPTNARSRPFSPCDELATGPGAHKIAPTGAKTNANTTDNVASTLVSSRGQRGGVWVAAVVWTYQRDRPGRGWTQTGCARSGLSCVQPGILAKMELVMSRAIWWRWPKSDAEADTSTNQ